VRDGAIPGIGLGTWALTGPEGVDAMLSALAAGYRHIDTAQSYDTEANVGEAVARSGISREKVFVTTKIAGGNFPRLADSLRDSLDRLGMDKVDLTLIHWPAPDDEPPVASYMADLARAQDEGLTRLIGVSNFTRRQIDEAIAAIGEGRIATNQVECHPFLQNRILAGHCAARGLPLTAYIPIARGAVNDDPVLREIAAAHDATPAQVSLAFLMARGHIVIPKSANPERQRQNIAATDLKLTDDEMDRIGALDRGQRFVDPDTAPDWD
jgi:2,5-diketo-D-gluconate reductase B